LTYRIVEAHNLLTAFRNINMNNIASSIYAKTWNKINCK